jgi:hypothetical protein
MTVETDITALQGRCAALETRDAAADAAIATLSMRVSVLEGSHTFETESTFETFSFA